MNFYKLSITETFFQNLEEIINYKLSFGSESTNKFREEVINLLSTLEYFPNKGLNIFHDYKSIIYKTYLIIYKVILERSEVIIIDIIDSRQHTKFEIYKNT